MQKTADFFDIIQYFRFTKEKHNLFSRIQEQLKSLTKFTSVGTYKFDFEGFALIEKIKGSLVAIVVDAATELGAVVVDAAATELWEDFVFVDARNLFEVVAEHTLQPWNFFQKFLIKVQLEVDELFFLLDDFGILVIDHVRTCWKFWEKNVSKW